jgi:hypothetical protein
MLGMFGSNLENTLVGAGTGILVVLMLMGAISVATSVGGTKWRLIGLAINAGIAALVATHFSAVEDAGFWLAVQSGVYAGAQGAVASVGTSIAGTITGGLNSFINSVFGMFGI